jgi:pimeloyl-ACP methyl ester carboxylesterase
MKVIGLNMAYYAIAGIGTTFLIISGSIDLSIGSSFALAAVSSAMMAKVMPVELAFVCGILVAGAVGLINGILTWKVPVSPIIITLGGLSLLHGLVLVITHGYGVLGAPNSFTWFGRAEVFGGVPMSVVVFLGGADSIMEEMALLGGPAFTEAGLHCLVLDGPGQGAPLRFENLYTRPDYEVVYGAALDYLATRPECDTDRAGVVGISMGGYYGARAVAFEPRVKVAALFGALYDAADLYDQYPPLREQFRWLTGARDMEDTRARMARFNLSGVAEKITCPFLILHGEHDRQVFVSDAYKLCEAASSEQKELKIFTEQEGGSAHCQNDNRVLAINYIADWLEDVLVHGRKRSGVHVGER